MTTTSSPGFGLLHYSLAPYSYRYASNGISTSVPGHSLGHKESSPNSSSNTVSAFDLRPNHRMKKIPQRVRLLHPRRHQTPDLSMNLLLLLMVAIPSLLDRNRPLLKVNQKRILQPQKVQRKRRKRKTISLARSIHWSLLMSTTS